MPLRTTDVVAAATIFREWLIFIHFIRTRVCRLYRVCVQLYLLPSLKHDISKLHKGISGNCPDDESERHSRVFEMHNSAAGRARRHRPLVHSLARLHAISCISLVQMNEHPLARRRVLRVFVNTESIISPKASRAARFVTDGYTPVLDNFLFILGVSVGR